MLADFCSNQGYNCCRMDGQTPTATRMNIVRQFNMPGSNHCKDFFILHVCLTWQLRFMCILLEIFKTTETLLDVLNSILADPFFNPHQL